MGVRLVHQFKLKAASRVLDEGRSVPEGCASLDIGPTALRRWVDQVRKMTYIKVGKCWMYFVVVLDLFARTNSINQIGVRVSVLPGIP